MAGKDKKVKLYKVAILTPNRNTPELVVNINGKAYPLKVTLNPTKQAINVNVIPEHVVNLLKGNTRLIVQVLDEVKEGNK